MLQYLDEVFPGRWIGLRSQRCLLGHPTKPRWNSCCGVIHNKVYANKLNSYEELKSRVEFKTYHLMIRILL